MHPREIEEELSNIESLQDIHPRDYHKINSDIRIISHYAGSRAEKEEDIKGLIEEFCVERNRPVYLLNAEILEVIERVALARFNKKTKRESD